MSHTAVEGEYRAVYTKVDEKRWYSIAYTTRIQAIENYRRSDEHKLDVGQGTGYIWRVYTITKFEERDGGVYVEIEAICLSRDVPITLRWLIDPMIRRLSKSSLTSYMASTALRRAFQERECGAGPESPKYPHPKSGSRAWRRGRRPEMILLSVLRCPVFGSPVRFQFVRDRRRLG